MEIPGDLECDHEWGSNRIVKAEGLAGSGVGKIHIGAKYNPRDENLILKYEVSQGQFCLKCGTWRGSLGLEPTIEAYIGHMVLVCRELRRVLRKDGVFFLNVGDSYSNYRTGYQGALNPQTFHNGDQRGKPAGYNPRRAEKQKGLKEKDLCGIPWRLALALQADGWWLRSDIIWAKANPLPESVTDRPTKSHEYVFLLTKSTKYFWDTEAVREPHTESTIKRIEYGLNHKHPENVGIGIPPVHTNRMGERFANPTGRNLRTVWNINTQSFSQAHFATFPEKLVEPMIKAGTSERGCCPQCGAPWVRVVEKEKAKGNYRQRKDCVEDVPGNPMYRGGTHNSGLAENAFYKTRTLDWRPSCGCGQEDTVPSIVLDPFFGAGTTGLVAAKLGRDCIGIEIKPEYADMAAKRLKSALGLLAAVEVE